MNPEETIEGISSEDVTPVQITLGLGDPFSMRLIYPIPADGVIRPNARNQVLLRARLEEIRPGDTGVRSAFMRLSSARLGSAAVMMNTPSPRSQIGCSLDARRIEHGEYIYCYVQATDVEGNMSEIGVVLTMSKGEV